MMINRVVFTFPTIGLAVFRLLCFSMISMMIRIWPKYITSKSTTLSAKWCLVFRNWTTTGGGHRSVVTLSDPNISYEYGSPTAATGFRLFPLTLGEMLERSCRLNPDKSAFIVMHQNVEKSYREFNRDVDRLARRLYADIGVRRGHRVGIWAINCYEWLVVQFATAKLGAIMVAINPGYRERELANCMKLVQLETLIMNQRFKTSVYHEILERLSPGLINTINGHRVTGTGSERFPPFKNLIVIDEPAGEPEVAPENIIRFSQLLKTTDDDDETIPLNKMIAREDQTEFDDIINIQFTSGSTGQPKASMATHQNIVSNVQCITPRFFDGMRPDQPETLRMCLPNPLFHAMGCVLGSAATVLMNGTMVLPGPVVNPIHTVEAIHRYRCNFLFGTPTMWSDLLHGGVPQFDLATLKRGLMSGSFCPPPLLEKVFRAIPSLENILIPYGTTETGPVATATSIHDDRCHQIESVGKPIAFAEIKVIDMQTKRIIPRGQKGEVCIRGPGVFPGYFNQPDKTREVVDDNFWYHTGDVGFMDREGYLTICGRIKEMIIRGGENIYPREVEELMLAHESIEDVHVVGIPDERLGEELVAYVKLKRTVKILPTERQLKDSLKTQMSHFKVPRHIRFVDDYPRTQSGKVQKFILKQMAHEEFAEHGNHGDDGKSK